MKKKDFSGAKRARNNSNRASAAATVIHDRLTCEKGQTSIFVALIFQALFVLFAMALNVGMVVHDKINLQNSVDLAAYYAGQKQAEWLNVIAHTNYQVRQAWKLFTFRYRVMGTMGMDGRTPAGAASAVARHPTYDPPNYAETPWDPTFAQSPYACISYIGDWDTVGAGDNWCRVDSYPVPALPQVAVIAAFNPINAAIAALTANIQTIIGERCQGAGAYSWYWAAAAAQSYRVSQRNRLQTIEFFANNLGAPDPVDINGDPISMGAERTFQGNLTNENFSSGPDFEMLNGMEGLTAENWLPEVNIAPFVRYMDAGLVGSGTCQGDPKNITTMPGFDILSASVADGIIRNNLNAADLIFWMNSMNSFLTDPSQKQWRYTLGVEKNPWYMAYMGVRAQVTSRPIFFPFGGGVTLVAEAYAKPFGGRIGPWYYNSWARSAPESSGERIDLQVPYRVAAGSNGMALDASEQNMRLPNYSKYPGDQIGFASFLSQNAYQGLKTSTGNAGDNNQLAWFQRTWLDIDAARPVTHDKLSWDEQNDAPPRTRFYELAAIAPDIFDITYYSIEPNFYDNYFLKISSDKTKGAIGLDPNIVMRPDMGFRPGTVEQFNVQQQMEAARGVGTGGPAIQVPQAFY
ncbi:MAG: Tad domain-containing protein, partial [Pseudomonadota bacterium]